MASDTGKRTAKARIYVVDDHPVVRSGLAELINQETDMLVCGEAESAEEALRDIPQKGPHLAIVDLTLKEASGLELIKALKARHPELPTLVLSMHDESVFAERAMRAGARGFLMKNSMMDQIQVAIRLVLKGQLYLSPEMTQRMVAVVAGGKKRGEHSPLERLSDRELEVFELIGRGLGTSEIARRLHLSVKTIDTHRASIRDKMGLKDAKQIVHHAVQWIQDL